MAQSNTPVVQLIRHTESDSLIALQWEAVLQAEGYESPLPVHLDSLMPGQCDVAILLGVSPNVPYARQAVERVEQCYPMAEILIMTHHQNKMNIAQFKGSRAQVVGKLISESEFLCTVKRMLWHRQTKTAPK